jgi:hypothetical protein
VSGTIAEGAPATAARTIGADAAATEASAVRTAGVVSTVSGATTAASVRAIPVPSPATVKVATGSAGIRMGRIGWVMEPRRRSCRAPIMARPGAPAGRVDGSGVRPRTRVFDFERIR